MSKKLDMALDDIVEKDERSGGQRRKQGGRDQDAGYVKQRKAELLKELAELEGRDKAYGKSGYGGRQQAAPEKWRRRSRPYEEWQGWSRGSNSAKGYNDGWRDRGGELKLCKVGPDSDVHKTAGYIAAALRNGGPVTLSATSANGMNQALKALALARQLVAEEQLDLSLHPIVDDYDDRDPEYIEMMVSVVTDGWLRDSSPETKLTVSGESLPSKVAGSVAYNMREGVDVAMTAMGPQAISRCVRSIYVAQQYLDADETNDSGEIVFVPNFGHTRDKASRMIVDVYKLFRTCRMTGESDIHKSAGYISAGVRDCRPPAVVACDAAAVGQAVKAVAVARTFLEKDSLDIMVRPEDLDDDSIRLSITIVDDGTIREEIRNSQGDELYVSSESEPGKVAGAIAKRLRESTAVSCTALGPYAMLRAVKSITLARRYLANEVGVIYFAPHFEQESGRGPTKMRLHLFAE
eukprot:TRINITY_DN3031_c0_g1_i2.p1 TRINITY_DN3031_c0_g1~~TRINITY_DN3031_c0_g1_i2.p1  ORF type:complete len:464 (+),score=109.41 TRINITY_DN3031_c0_g1_i2:141-1532(+)